ncbi:MAG: hypothetical protein FWC43_05845 [Planctomycetaceae bacterium]|nr:hypothetical protein [Planctomycetaceae bacterium]
MIQSVSFCNNLPQNKTPDLSIKTVVPSWVNLIWGMAVVFSFPQKTWSGFTKRLFSSKNMIKTWGSFILYPLSSILYPLSSILYPLSSILYPLSSIPCPL